MRLDQTSINDIGLEYIKWPIIEVRIHRTDGQWLVEYRRKPKWFFDRWWWFNDGKFVDYTTANRRAVELSDQGFTLKIRYKRDKYVVSSLEDYVRAKTSRED